MNPFIDFLYKFDATADRGSAIDLQPKPMGSEQGVQETSPSSDSLPGEHQSVC